MKSKNKKRAEAAERMKNSSYQTSRALRLETKTFDDDEWFETVDTIIKNTEAKVN